jgi:hypothetical protein
MCRVGQPASCLIIGWKWNASAFAGPLDADARSAPLRENRLSRHLGALPVRRPVLGLASPRRGGLRTPASETSLSPRDGSIRPPSVPLPLMIMICLALRTAVPRGRGDRAPPRKPPSALSPGLSPVGHLISERPRRGGAGSARPRRRHNAKPKIGAFWPPDSRPAARSNDLPRFAWDPYLRTRRAHPSPEPTLRVIPGFPPQGLSLGPGPPEGRAPHARKNGLGTAEACLRLATRLSPTRPQ